MDTMERFWSKVDRRGPDECWPWTGSVCRGYGQFYIRCDGKTVAIGAHRIALAGLQWVFPTLLCCHHCDNPLCCNPRHLYFGTTQMNTADRCARNRHGPTKPRGVANLARQMFEQGMSKHEIARRLGVTSRAVREAVNNPNPRKYVAKSPHSPPAPPLAPT